MPSAYRTTLLAACAAGLAACAVAAPAGAATFCVNAPACVAGGGTASATPLTAAAAANAASGPDRIEIGAGAYPLGSSSTISLTGPTELVGAGRTSTVISVTGNAAAINVAANDTSVSDLRIELVGGPTASPVSGAAGIKVVAAAVGIAIRRVEVAASGAHNDIGAIQSQTGSVLIEQSAVSVPDCQSSCGYNTGINLTYAGSPDPIVRDVDIAAQTGVFVRAPDASGPALQRLRVHPAPYGPNVAASVGVWAVKGRPLVTSSVITAGSTSNGAVVAAGFGTADSPSVTARNVTLFGGPACLRAFATTLVGTATVAATDSVMRCSSVGSTSVTGVAATAQISVVSSSFPFGTHTGTGLFSAGAGNLDNPDPRFLDEAGGDYRLRFDSPLIDRNAALLGPNESALDLAGLPRLIDGNGTGGPSRDMGAFEYGYAAPSVTAAATPAGPSPGAAVTFTASGTDPDPGEGPALSYAWTFSDGTTAAGPSATRVAPPSGSLTGTVTVTDPAGRTASATATAATAPPTARPPARDRTRPSVAILRPRAGARLRSRALRALSGRASDAGGLARVDVALARTERSGRRLRCRFIGRTGAPERTRRACAPRTYRAAAGTRSWRYALRRRLPAGSYRAWVRARDRSGNVTVRTVAFRIV